MADETAFVSRLPQSFRTSSSVEPRCARKCWGEDVTSYGGIGKLPFLDQVRIKRDLFVTRSHKHFGSCITRCLNNVQPYQLTSLKRSGCRMNDQILPAVGKVDIDLNKFPLPACTEKTPYFSHRPKFEVFPRNNSERTQLRGRAVLTQNSIAALKELDKKLYETPFYNVSYPCHVKSRQKPSPGMIDVRLEDLSPNTAKLNIPKKCNVPLPDAVLELLMVTVSMGDLNRVIKLLMELKDIHICQHGSHNFVQHSIGASQPNCLLEKLIDITASKHLNVPAKLTTLTKVLRVSKHETSLASQRQFTDEVVSLIQNQPKVQTEDPQLPGIGSSWPPSPCYYLNKEHMTLKETQSFHQNGVSTTTANNARMKSSDSSIDSQTNATEEEDRIVVLPPGLPTYKPYINQQIPTKLEGDENDGPSNTQDALVEWYRRICGRVPEFERENYCPSQEPSLRCRLHPPGGRIQDGLGLQFRSEAHRRYHALYPDLVPDLRTSHVTTKKYFFFGHHASSFR